MALVTATALPAQGESFAAHGGSVRALALDSSGTKLASGGFDYRVLMWDLETGEVQAEHDAHNAPLNVAAFVGGVLWTGDQAGALLRWNGLDAPEPLEPHGGPIAALTAAPDGSAAVAASWDGEVRWYAADGRIIARHNHRQTPTALAFPAPDRALLGDRSGAIWQLSPTTDDALLASPLVDPSGFGITALSLATEGRLAATTLAGKLRLFDSETGTLVAEQVAERTPLLSVTASRDGSWLVTTGGEGFVQLWESSSLTPVRAWQAHTKSAWVAALDGRARLFTAGADGAIRRWETGSGQLELGPALAVTVSVADAEHSDQGEKLFRTCAACHTLEEDGTRRAGPTLAGVFGRRAGTVAGYPYSPALKDSDIVWSAETIDALFREGPHVVTPGSKMPLQQMPDADDRRALIAYLKRTTGSEVDPK